MSLRTWSSIDEAPRFEGSSRETQVGEERKGVGKLKNCKTEDLQRGQKKCQEKYFHEAP